MRHFLTFAGLAVLTPFGAAAAPPDDAGLLEWIRGRERHELVTPEPVAMEKRTAADCRPPSTPPPEGPHKGAMLKLFVSADAAEALFDPWGKFPVGSVIVKEKLPADGKGSPQLFTGMLKREAGFWPELGDWEFFTADGKASAITSRGRLESCAACHRDYAEGGFVTRRVVLPRPDAPALQALPSQLSGGRVILHAARATVQGSRLRYEPQEKKNTLGFWTDPADHAHWTFTLTRPGRYSVTVLQGCGKGSGGAEVEVRCEPVTPADAAKPEPLRFTVEDTGHFQNFKEREIGSVSLEKPGTWRLVVQPKSKPGVAVMDLRCVVLTPEAPGAGR